MIGSAIVEALSSAFARMIGRNLMHWATGLLTFLGISFVSYSAIVEPIMDWFQAKLADLPSSITAWMGALGIDVALTILMSALLTVMLLKVGIRKRV